MCSQNCLIPPSSPNKKNVPPPVPPSSLPSCLVVIDLQLGLGLLAALQELADAEAEHSDSDCNTWLANKNGRHVSLARGDGGMHRAAEIRVEPTYQQRRCRRRP